MPQEGQNQTDSVHIRPPHWLLFIYVPPTLPGLPSPLLYLHTASYQKLEVGKVWECSS